MSEIVCKGEAFADVIDSTCDRSFECFAPTEASTR